MPTRFKTCRRYNEPGHAHELTFSCYQRQPFLGRDRSRRWLVEAIERSRTKHDFDVWAFVVMPEHVHLLIFPKHTTYNISDILATLKQSVTRCALNFVRSEAPRFLAKMEDRQPNGTTQHRFWQRGGGYDRNLTEPSSIFAAIDYIHANPVRRKLCDRPAEWPWSSAAEFERAGSGPLSLNLDSLPRTLEG